MKKRKISDERLTFILETLIIILCMEVIVISILFASLVSLPLIAKVLIIIAAIAMFGISIWYSLKVEQQIGKFRCSKCGHLHVPEMKNIWASMHMGRTRYLKCPKCHQYSWQPKIIDNDKEIW